MLQKSS